MSPTALKIKTKLLQEGDTFEALANEWDFSRALLTKVAHGERTSGQKAEQAQRRLARYMGQPVRDLFPEYKAVTRKEAA